MKKVKLIMLIGIITAAICAITLVVVFYIIPSVKYLPNKDTELLIGNGRFQVGRYHGPSDPTDITSDFELVYALDDRNALVH